VSVEMSKRGYEKLKSLGVETDMVTVTGAGHAYDGEVKEGDERWAEGVQKGLDFLIKHV